MLWKRHRERLLAIAAVLPICFLMLWLLPHAQTSFIEDSLEAVEKEEEARSAEELRLVTEEARQMREVRLQRAAVAALTAQMDADQQELASLAEESLRTADPYTWRNKEVRELMLLHAAPLETEDAAGPDAEKLLDAGLLDEPGFEGEESVGYVPFPPEKMDPPMPNMVIHESGYYALGESGLIATWDGQLLPYVNVLRCSCTAYTTERQLNKITATGTVAHVGGVAVDPTVIRYGTQMYIVAEDGSWTYGYACAEDCGGGIKGYKIDLFMDTYDECIQFGVRPAMIYILG